MQGLVRCPCSGAKYQTGSEAPSSLTIASTNMRGMLGSTRKRLRLRWQLEGSHGLPQCDVLLLQETVGTADGTISDHDAAQMTVDIVGKGGRGWWTGHCAILLSERASAIVANVRQSIDGRLLRMDYTAADGAKRTLGCVYAPANGKDRQTFMRSLSAMLSPARRTLLGGDFNCVHSMTADVLNGAPTCNNTGYNEWRETAQQLDMCEVISARDTERHTTDLATLTWASSPTARGIVQKRLDWFAVSTDHIDEVGDITTLQPWMSLANGSAATDHATIITELTLDARRATEAARDKPKRTKLNWQIARRGRFLHDMRTLLTAATAPIEEMHADGLHEEVQLYCDRLHDDISQLYDEHRRAVDRGKRAGSRKARRALSDYVTNALRHHDSPDDVSTTYFDKASRLRLAYEDEARRDTTSDWTTARDFDSFDTKSLFARAKGPKAAATFTKQKIFRPPAQGDATLADDEQRLDDIADQSLADASLWTTAKGLARAVMRGETIAVGAPGEETCTGIDNMMENSRLFYAWLFRQRRVNVKAQDRLVESFPLSEALTQDIVDQLGEPLTNEEVERGCRGLNPGKAPGPDGMIAEIYRGNLAALWAPILRCSFNSGLARGEMSPQQRQGIICLIFKAKSKLDLANWRPATLVPKQYAVCSLCLNNRWTPHAPKLLLTDQAGFTTGRYMYTNIRASLDAVDFARERDLDLALVAADFKKAFDALDRGYLFRILNRMLGVEQKSAEYSVAEMTERGLDLEGDCTRPGNPPDAGFVLWVKCLYARHERVVRVNGYETEPLPLCSGVPQGDILAASCFGAGVEPLGRMLKAAGLRGITADNGETMTFCRFADDLELFVHPDDLDAALDILAIYCSGSGMFLNASKCEGLWIGKQRDCQVPWQGAVYGDATADEKKAARLTWLRPGGSIRVLGVQVGDSNDATAEWRDVANRMLTAMRRWTGTRLSYQARVLILQATVWSLPSFLALYRTPPAGLLDRMYAASRYFLWKNRLPTGATVDTAPQGYRCAYRASRTTLALPRSKGGLGWSDPRMHIATQRAKWIAMLLEPEDANLRRTTLSWQTLPRYFISQLGNGAEYDTSALIDEPNLAALATRAGDKIPSEWHDTIGAWASLRTHMRRVPPQSYESTMSMRLRHNADITAGGVAFHGAAWDALVANGCCTVGDAWHSALARPYTAPELQAQLASRTGADPASLATLDFSLPGKALQQLPDDWWQQLQSGPRPLADGEWVGRGGTGDVPTVLAQVVLSDAGGVVLEMYERGETAWHRNGCISECEAVAWRRVLTANEQRDGSVTIFGYEAATFGRSGWRLRWHDAGDSPERHDSLMGFTVRRAMQTQEQVERVDSGDFAERGLRLAAALDYTGSLSAAARVVLRSPWRAEVKNFAWELVTGCLLTGMRGNGRAPTDDCAACGAVVVAAGDITDSALHVLTTCAITATLRRWATGVIQELAGGDWGHSCVTTETGFGQFLAYGGGDDICGNPALMAIRGACLHALRSARAEAHAAHDDADERRERLMEEAEIDSILGVLPAAPTTYTVDGWSPERVVAECGRELRTHISCDYSVAKGAYESNPDHAGYPQARPRSNAAFQGMWGRLCWLDGSQLVFADVLDTTI